MNILSGPATTSIRRKANEIVAFLNVKFPGTTTIMSLSGGTSNQLAIVATGAAKGFSVVSTVQTENDLNTITTATAVTSAALMKALNVSMTASSASSNNMLEVSRFTLTSAVRTGQWANAVVGKIDFTTTGFVTGLAGAVCAELDLPTTNPTAGAGTYTCFEGELVYPASGYSSDVPVSFINLNLSGVTKTVFDTYGYILDIQGIADHATGKVFQANTAAAATHALRIRINTESYYIMLTDTGA